MSLLLFCQIKYHHGEILPATCIIATKDFTSSVESIRLSLDDESSISIELLDHDVSDAQAYSNEIEIGISFSFKRNFSDCFSIIFGSISDQQAMVTAIRNRVKYRAVQAKQFYDNPIVNQSSAMAKNNIPCDQEVSIFEIFPKQDLAFHYYDSLPATRRWDCKIFTYESIQLGKRYFLVSDLTTFCAEYLGSNKKQIDQPTPSHLPKYYTNPSLTITNNTPPSSSTTPKHVYEIICESFPCRLYFDVEYRMIAENLPLKGSQLLQKWISLVIWKFYELYKLYIGYENIVVLDSSTDEKFSKHVNFILQLPNIDSSRKKHLNHDTASSSSSKKRKHMDNTEDNDKIEDTTNHKEFLFVNNQELIHFIQLILYDISLPATEQQIQQHHQSTNSNNMNGDISSSTIPGIVLSKDKAVGDELHNNIMKEGNDNTVPPLLFQLQGEFRIPRMEYEDFWVYAESKEGSSTGNMRTFFIDLGVYTRNRAFRLYKSCKYKKKKILSIHPEKRWVVGDKTACIR